MQFVQKRDAYRHEGGGVKFSQFVGASTSMNSFYQRLRVAGAQARELFLTAGAKYFKVSIEDCLTENSHVIHQKTGKKVAYGQLLDFIENIELNPKPQLKNNSENSQSIEGKKIKRVDTPAKVDGSAIFGIDVDVPNMLIGVPWMLPSYTGKIVKINNEEAIKAMPGVVDLVLTRHLNSENMKGLDKNNDINTIIVVAESFWQAKQVADSLDVEYDLGSAANTSTKTIDADNQARIARDDLIEVINRGQVKQKIAEAKKDSDNYHEAAYEMPYLTHGTMEPCNTTCHVRDGEVEVWGPYKALIWYAWFLAPCLKFPLTMLFYTTPTSVVALAGNMYPTQPYMLP